MIFYTAQMIAINLGLKTFGRGDIRSTVWFAWTYFAVSVISLVVMSCGHFYLLDMGVKLQRIFRQFGHVEGRSGTVVMFVSYVFYCGFLFYWYIFKPVILLLINTSDFSCS